MAGEESPIDEFEELLAERAQLASAADSASSYSSDLYKRALKAADSHLGQLSEQGPVRAYLTEIGGPAVRGLEELDKLGGAVKFGFVSPEEIEERRAEVWRQVEADPRVAYAVGYLGGSAVAGTVNTRPAPRRPRPVAPSPEAGSPAIEQTGEVSKIKLEITYSDGALQIGRSGIFIKTRKTRTAKHEGQHDYSEERLKVLEFLIKAGREVTAPEIMSNALDISPDADRQVASRAMLPIRTWLEKLTYRRQPLVIHNGVRGRTSAYIVNPGFDLKLVRRQVTELSEPPTTPLYTETRQAETDSGKTEEIRHQPSYFPLGRFESLMVADFLTMHNDVIEAIGFQPIPESVAEALRHKITNRDQAIGERTYGSDVKVTRQLLMEKLRAFFDDQELVGKAVGQMDENDERYGLFEYFFENFETEELWTLFDQLINAQRRLVYEADTGRRRGSSQPEAGHVEVWVEGPDGPKDLLAGRGRPGDQFSTGTDIGRVSFASEAVIVTELSFDDDVDAGLELGDVGIGKSQPETEVVGRVATAGSAPATESAAQPSAETPVPPGAETIAVDEGVREQQRALEQFTVRLRQKAKEWLQEIESYSLVGRGSRSMINLYPFMTRKFINNASENGLIGREARGLSEFDLLKLFAAHEYKDEMANVKRTGNSANKRLIISVLREEFRAYEQAKRQAES